jgi:hypothetical protein
MRHQDAVETFTAGEGNHKATGYLHVDEDASNPREEQDNFGRIVCWHSRYTLGDEAKFLYNGKEIHDAWDGPTEFQEWAKRQRGIVVLPLYLYDHSGITMSTGAFGNVWDSGQVGYIYATREMILANWQRKRLDKQLVASAAELLKSEVAQFDEYLRGAVYGYSVEDSAGKTLDSCWGFYGQKYAIEEVQGITMRGNSRWTASSPRP